MDEPRSHGREHAQRPRQGPAQIGGCGYPEVLPGYAEGLATQAAHVDDVGQIVPYQCYVCRFNSHIGAAGAHGNADVGFGQGQGVVDAVAHHNDFVPVAL